MAIVSTVRFGSIKFTQSTTIYEGPSTFNAKHSNRLATGLTPSGQGYIENVNVTSDLKGLLLFVVQTLIINVRGKTQLGFFQVSICDPLRH